VQWAARAGFRRNAVSLPPLPPPGPRLLRVLEGAVLDFPAPTLHPEALHWAATWWPDPTEPSGWSRALWWPSPYHLRGLVPVELAYADVIEFGADFPVVTDKRAVTWTPVRWYGLVLEDTARGMVVHGPYPTPAAAETVADELRRALGHYYANRRRP
jgi:hypothetical protein